MNRATADDQATTSASCRRCGLSLGWQADVVSTHRTSDGDVVYTRCGVCGLLQVWARPDLLGAAELITRWPDR